MQTLANIFEERLFSLTTSFRPVVPFTPADAFLQMDFTSANKALTPAIINNTPQFSGYISQKLQQAGAKYGIGGYNEHRTIYARSKLFGSTAASTAPTLRHGVAAAGKFGNETGNGSTAVGKPRRLHLGTDIWGAAETPVMAPLSGTVHSFAFNNNFGDYGATIILLHQIGSLRFHTLYGHLSLRSLENLKAGNFIEAGTAFAQFGVPEENGHWPPHLHFQIILDMQGYKGDYLGVCAFEERNAFLANCPNPELLLQIQSSGATIITA